MRDQVEVCPLSRGIMLARTSRNPYLHHYGAAFAFSTLLCPQPYRLVSRPPYPCRRGYGFTAFGLRDTDGLGSLYTPVAFDAHDRKAGSSCTTLRCRFWLKPDSTFGLLGVYGAFECLHMLTLPSTLVPICRSAGRSIVASQFRCQPFDCGFIVPRLYTGCYRPAFLGRVQLVEQPVPSTTYRRVEQSRRSLSRRTPAYTRSTTRET
jgi:hypothetical protein